MRTGKWTALLVLVLALSAQGQREERVTLLPSSEVKTARHSYPPPGGAITGTWQPTPADIASAEANLAQIGRMTPRGWPATIHIDHPEQYYRQYLGILHGSRKLLYLNAFCTIDSATSYYWRIHFYWVNDGASCFFQTLYDPSTQQFSGLQINPRA
jgi:hypothetical protein